MKINISIRDGGTGGWINPRPEQLAQFKLEDMESNFEKPLIDKEEVRRIYDKEVDLGGVWSNYTFEEFLKQIETAYTVTEG